MTRRSMDAGTSRASRTSKERERDGGRERAFMGVPGVDGIGTVCQSRRLYPTKTPLASVVPNGSSSWSATGAAATRGRLADKRGADGVAPQSSSKSTHSDNLDGERSGGCSLDGCVAAPRGKEGEIFAE